MDISMMINNIVDGVQNCVELDLMKEKETLIKEGEVSKKLISEQTAEIENMKVCVYNL